MRNQSYPNLKKAIEKRRYFAPRRIPAISVQPGPQNDTGLGVISHLPQGCEISVCGDGFDDRTIKVEWQGSFFYVFFEDLESGNEGRS